MKTPGAKNARTLRLEKRILNKALGKRILNKALKKPRSEKPYFLKGGVSIKAGSDALTAALYPLSHVISRKIRLAFRHSLILFYACRACPALEQYCPQLLLICKEDLYQFLKMRAVVNQERETKGSPKLETTDEIEAMVDQFITEHGPFTEEFTENQLADIAGVTNSWCLSKSSPMNTVDTVLIVFDDNGTAFAKFIQRECSPGKGLYAFSGGIVEEGESGEEAVEREDKEEAPVTVSGIKFKRTEVFMQTNVPSRTFDIRYQFGLASHGFKLIVLDPKRKHSIIITNDYNMDSNIY